MWSWNADRKRLFVVTEVKPVGLNENASSVKPLFVFHLLNSQTMKPPLLGLVVMETDGVELQLSVRIVLLWVPAQFPSVSHSGNAGRALGLRWGCLGVTVMTSERLVPLRPSADVLTALCVFVAAEKFVLFHKERCCCSTFVCVLLFVHRRVVVKVFVQEGVCLVTVVVEVRRWKPVFLLQVKYSCLSSLTACRAFRTDGSEPSAALKPRPDGPEVSFHAHLPASRAQTFMLEGFYPERRGGSCGSSGFTGHLHGLLSTQRNSSDFSFTLHVCASSALCGAHVWFSVHDTRAVASSLGRLMFNSVNQRLEVNCKIHTRKESRLRLNGSVSDPPGVFLRAGPHWYFDVYGKQTLETHCDPNPSFKGLGACAFWICECFSTALLWFASKGSGTMGLARFCLETLHEGSGSLSENEICEKDLKIWFIKAKKKSEK